MHVVLVEVALEVVREEAMAVAVAVGTISVSLAFDDALGGGELFDHGLAAVGRRVVQGEMQWKPYYTTSATTRLLHKCVEFKQILRGIQNSTVQSVSNERSWLR